jgi:hypothetical protein
MKVPLATIVNAVSAPIKLLPAIVCVLLILWQSETKIYAQQWNGPTAGGDIYNANTGKVGIGTTTPSALLSVMGDGGANVSLPQSGDFGGTMDGTEARYVHFAATSLNDGSAGDATLVSSFSFPSPNWRMILRGSFLNNNEGGGLPQMPPYIEITNTGNTILVGSVALSFTKNASNQIQVQASCPSGVAPRSALFKGWVEILPSLDSAPAGSVSALFAGNVGIGTTVPQQSLHLYKSAAPAIQVDTANNVGYLNFSNSNVNKYQTGIDNGNGTAGYFVYDNTNSRYFISENSSTGNLSLQQSGGNVGVGTTTPDGKLIVHGGGAADVTNPAIGLDNNVILGWKSAAGATARNFIFADTTNSLNFGTNNATRVTMDTNGNVGIGTTSPSSRLHVVGDVTVTGNISAKYQDMAEWVTATRPARPGSVVILDPEHANSVVPSGVSYDTTVAGVVSSNPGIVLGESAAEKVPVATTGRVKVRVDASRFPIRIGDLLVTSDKEGVAMRSEPVEFAGVKMHRPGTLIGKALESLDAGEGEILVLLSLQ